MKNLEPPLSHTSSFPSPFSSHRKRLRKSPSHVYPRTRFINARSIFSCIPSIPSYWKKPHLQSPPWHFPSPVSFIPKLLTGCADSGSLLFFPNPLPDFPPSQIYKGFRGNAVRHQMVEETFQLLIYSLQIVEKLSAISLIVPEMRQKKHHAQSLFDLLHEEKHNKLLKVMNAWLLLPSIEV